MGTPLGLLLGCADGAAAPAPPAPEVHLAPGFWDHWGDGRGEIDRYALVTPRYGELRSGDAVLVFVTEDFTDAQRVKSDGGRCPGPRCDEYPVWKLNDIRQFQTGVYDYEVMTSTFLRLDSGPLGVPAKVSSSVQEWCGHAYAQLLPRRDGVHHTLHSYFDGEGDQDRTLPLPAGAVFVDALPLLVRGWAGALVEPGGERTFPAMTTLLHQRFAHAGPTWTEVTLARAPGSTTATVPAGTFEVVEHRATVDGVTTTWQVEVAAPYRIVAWSRTDGEHAELVSSERLAYWERNHEGQEGGAP